MKSLLHGQNSKYIAVQIFGKTLKEIQIIAIYTHLKLSAMTKIIKLVKDKSKVCFPDFCPSLNALISFFFSIYFEVNKYPFFSKNGIWDTISCIFGGGIEFYLEGHTQTT